MPSRNQHLQTALAEVKSEEAKREIYAARTAIKCLRDGLYAFDRDEHTIKEAIRVIKYLQKPELVKKLKNMIKRK